MIKIERVITPSPEQWIATIMGARNAMNSWDRSDSKIMNTVLKEQEVCPGVTSLVHTKCEPYISIGPNDHELLMKLARGGSTHAKYRRMLQVFVDVTAPLYWLAELDTYKVGVTRNSCSFMHKGVSKPYDIDDFSIKDERIYKILSPIDKNSYELSYPYETTEFKVYTDHNGRTYRVYRNGMVIREAFDYVDNWGSGRTRHYEEAGATIYQDKGGYFVVKLSGRDGGHMLLHRLVAHMWCEKPDGANQVNHIDGNKGNNSAENLEWVTASENMQKAVESGLYDSLGDLHHRYRLWKHWVRIIPVQDRPLFMNDVKAGLTHKELAEKWNITPSQANNLRYDLRKSENEDLFQQCYVWDKLLEQLNYLRSLYLETRDEQVFQSIRILMPQGYMQRSTFTMNYEVLAGMYRTRKNHRLDEWKTFCDWIESLPYSELITGGNDGTN